MSAEPPASPTSMDSPKYPKPACVLGYPVADGGEEEEGRGTRKGMCLAAWGEGPNPEFTGEIKPLLGWIQAPAETWAAALLSIPPPGLCRTDFVTSRSFTKAGKFHHVFTFRG